MPAFENDLADLADLIQQATGDPEITPQVAALYRIAGAQLRAIRTPAQALDYADDLDLQSDSADDHTSRMLARLAGDVRRTVRPAHLATEGKARAS